MLNTDKMALSMAENVTSAQPSQPLLSDGLTASTLYSALSTALGGLTTWQWVVTVLLGVIAYDQSVYNLY
jgi:hypothetical protein